jgi:hypothetical protein
MCEARGLFSSTGGEERGREGNGETEEGRSGKERRREAKAKNYSKGCLKKLKAVEKVTKI